jgi:succinate dehydrogenase hydrophobic anchor subunit
MREKAGSVRNASDLKSAQNAWAILRERAQHVRVSGSPRLNAEWQEWLNLDSLLTVSNMIVASALQRKESRGAHFRSDYPEADNSYYLQNIYLQRQGEGMRLWLTPVLFTRLRPTAPVTRPGTDVSGAGGRMTQSSSPTRFSVTLPASGKPAYLGMWTRVFQRASSLILMVLLPWHWVNPYSRPVRIAVLFFVIFHAAAGVRVMLLDFGLAERWHRRLVWTLAGIGLIIFCYLAFRYA